jgi:hypothetical protein
MLRNTVHVHMFMMYMHIYICPTVVYTR